jgi:hypothetical protein
MIGRRLILVLLGALLVTSCSARSVRIADIKDRPGKYDEKTIAVSGVVTRSWGAPFVPYQFYNVSDGTGEIAVLSKAGRAPSKGAHVKVEGRLNEIASFGSSSIGLHLEERDRHIE